MLNQPSFAGRIFLALLLMILFYVLALSLAGVLMVLPIAAFLFAKTVPIKIAILSLIGGLMILWSILPRWDRFIAPGPRLTEKDQPELFEQLRSVAQSTDQSMPAEVYALPEMNAWVANRGGVMGIGSRRIMGIGIPLMQVLSTQQLRGVLAHEFGHYYGGDTKLGPWLFVTRAAIVRTVVNLSSNGSSILSLPFEWYMKLFLGLTQKVSRQQEFTADALAAKIVGPQAMGDALKVIHSQGMAFDAYWQYEYTSALECGYRPPMAKGFRDFSSKQKIKETIHSELDKAMLESKSGTYDSHPALKERIHAIEQIPGPMPMANDLPAIDWIRDVDGLEEKMINHLAKSIGVKSPEPIEWSESLEKILIPGYSRYIQQFSHNLGGMTIEQTAKKLSNPNQINELIHPEILPHLTESEARREMASRIVSVLAILAFKEQGWEIQNPIGESPYIQRHFVTESAQDSVVRLNPFEWIDQFIEKKITLDELIARYKEHAIDSVEVDQILRLLNKDSRQTK